MPHTHVDELYTAYLEGSLPDDLRWEVERHLATCPRCSAELAALRETVAVLRALPLVSAPAQLAAGVRARLQAPPRAPWLRPLLAGGLATAALAAVLVLVLWIPAREYALSPGRYTSLPLEVAQAPAPPAPKAKLPALTPPRPAAVPPVVGRVVDPFAGGPAAPATVATPKPCADAGTTVAKGTKPHTGEVASDAGVLIATQPSAAASTALPMGDGDAGDALEAAPAPAPAPAPTPTAEKMQFDMASSRSMSKMTTPPVTVTLAEADSTAKNERTAVISGGTLAQQHRTPPVHLATERVLPAGKGQVRVALRVTTSEGGTLRVGAPQSLSWKAQTITLTPPATATTVTLPTMPGGAAYTLDVNTPTGTTAYLLLLPGSARAAGGARLDTTGLAQLLRLASDAGVTVLCPAAFASAPLSADSAGSAADPTSLATLAVRRGYSTMTVNGVMTILPTR